jgi:hypothetical protein
VSGMPLDLLHWYSRTASTTPLLPCTVAIGERGEDEGEDEDAVACGRSTFV